MLQTALRTRHLSRNFGARRAVHDIGIDLKRGEVLGLLGQNGAGKSTVMQMLAGTLAPSGGEVFIDEISLAANPVAAKAHLGYLPEQPPLYVDMRVDAYLILAARLRRVSDPQAAATRAATRCGLADCGEQIIGRLSKGFRQRVGIAQAIVHRPRVLILDEPGGGLDPLQLREMRALIRELASECSVIFSTHFLSEAVALCDRLLILRAGESVFSGHCAELGAPDELEEAFIRLTRAESRS